MQDAALNRFLASVERRAFRHAEFAVRDREEALDIVQEAMLALVRRYRGRPEAEWSPLFWRILSSRIMDSHRRRGVRQRVFTWLRRGHDDDGEDPLEQMPAAEAWTPEAMLERAEFSEQLLDGIRGLPLRQQQAFLLRSWEGLSVEETAAAMGCSAGSVKTHHSRAVRHLRAALGGEGDD